MCQKATCTDCGKKSWWGCGTHIPVVMNPIPSGDRCSCGPKVTVAGQEYPPKAAQAD
ncbi:uncharacterized protein M437DRAFT_61227 [Aureobasidium melanogenum CBS 110374]|uniref:Uncharacterized protein n=1 Tax=Aureobasidium melanogenum (strain CBS 110374) TaxID=1043003 RepID=A0A074VB55_AURM1|nr:uncharacterized protein M437DRAFT_61227 [Aureobasidium melanogenum CBS 110374]KEQ57573.1 hypothetical protein M437DRAFT_61227 [Aureobasidium melanogenum CBS 110374]